MSCHARSPSKALTLVIDCDCRCGLTSHPQTMKHTRSILRRHRAQPLCRFPCRVSTSPTSIDSFAEFLLMLDPITDNSVVRRPLLVSSSTRFARQSCVSQNSQPSKALRFHGLQSSTTSRRRQYFARVLNDIIKNLL